MAHGWSRDGEYSHDAAWRGAPERVRFPLNFQMLFLTSFAASLVDRVADLSTSTCRRPRAGRALAAADSAMWARCSGVPVRRFLLVG